MKKTVLDLIGEFAALHDEKMGNGGTLPAPAEKRWVELRKFYELVGAQNGFPERRTTRRFAPEEIGQQLPRRTRLRVPIDMDVLVEYEGQPHTARVLNLSCGGVFLTSEDHWPVGSRLTLYLANIVRGLEALLEIRCEVAWAAEEGISEAGLPRGMGIRFVGLPKNIERKLDTLVLEILEKQLSTLDATALDPEFVRREQLVL